MTKTVLPLRTVSRTADFAIELQALLGSALKIQRLLLAASRHNDDVVDFVTALDVVQRQIIRLNKPETTAELTSRYADALFAAQTSMTNFVSFVESLSSSDTLAAMLNSPMRRRHLERLSVLLLDDFERLEKWAMNVITWMRPIVVDGEPRVLTEKHSELVLADAYGRRLWRRCFNEQFVGDVMTLLKRLYSDGHLASLTEAESLIDFFGETSV